MQFKLVNTQDALLSPNSKVVIVLKQHFKLFFASHRHLLHVNERGTPAPKRKTMKQTALSKAKDYLQKEGLIATVVKVIKYPVNRLKNKRFEKEILSLKSNEDKFTWIYKNNFWSSIESLSGTGSTLKYTENLRNELPKLFKMYSIKKVFDAPCGDFNWMILVLNSVNIEYIGADIVKPLIDNLNDKYKSKKIAFMHFDLVKDVPPEVDLMICRDCLFHLSFQDTKSVLENFIKSNSTYLLTTTHKNMENSFTNRDILTGDFRCIDLFSEPYSFPADPLHVIEDWIAPDPERQMCLWTRDQVLMALRAP